MLSHHLDLSRRPFVDTRPANVTAAALALFVLVLSLVSTRTIQRYLDQSQRTREAIVHLRTDVAREEERKRAAEASLAKVDLSGLSSSVSDANAIALRRAFSWTRFLSRLETALPEDVRVQSISLERSGKGVDKVTARLADATFPVHLVVVSRDPDGMPKTIRALYRSEFFDRPTPENEDAPTKGPGDGKLLRFSVLYRDRGAKP